MSKSDFINTRTLLKQKLYLVDNN